ncbi:MAG: hypothetical protein J6C07_01230 [Lachnospiraceae bacterium]|nr:hypothetical protein [Lachnospiraceae bacterium]
MYYILNYLLQNMVNLYCAVSVAFCLTPKYPRFRSIAIYTIISSAILLAKFTNFNNQVLVSTTALLMQLTFFMFTLISFRDSLYKKLIVFIIILLCNIMSELLCLLHLNSIASYTLALEPHSREFTIAILFILPLVFLLNLIFIFIWKYANSKKKNTLLLVFSILPMLQLLISAGIFAPALIEPDLIDNALIFICSLIATITIVILLCLLLRRQEKQSIQAAYQELQELYQVENEYYQTLEVRHEELAKIRHDYNNQIATLYMLISSNKLEAAGELANSMKQQMK